MKKLLTLVLALALVFALAAPAMAITGDISDDEPSSIAPVLLDVALFTTPPTNTGFGGFSVSQVAANKVYIVNEAAFYGVALKFYETDEDNEIGLDFNDYDGAELTLTSDALRLDDGVIKAYVFDEDGSKVSIADDPSIWKMEDSEWTVPDDIRTWESGNTVYFFGQGIVAAKGILKAELKKTSVIGSSSESHLDINDSDGDELYRVWKDGPDFIVEDPDSGRVKFEVDGDHEVTGIFVELDVTDAGEYDSGVAPTDYQEVEYKKLTGGSIVLVIGAYEGDDLDDAEDLYNDVMKFFGFDYNAEGKLLDKHFARKAASLYLKDEVAINLYTGSIIQPDPNVIPPKTGDAASFLGFAMIALALAAMGFVVIKKTVRA